MGPLRAARVAPLGLPGWGLAATRMAPSRSNRWSLSSVGAGQGAAVCVDVVADSRVVGKAKPAPKSFATRSRR